MQKADTLDRLLILAALLFFGLVCVLIVKRRIIDRGIRAATLFSRIAGAGSAPLRNAIPSNIKAPPPSSIASATSVVKATAQELSQSASSVLASVAASATASATVGAASLVGTSAPIPLSPSQSTSTSSQDASQSSMQPISEELTAIASVSSFSKTEPLEASLDATAVPIILTEEVVAGDQAGEVVLEEVPLPTIARHDHVMDEL